MRRRCFSSVQSRSAERDAASLRSLGVSGSPRKAKSLGKVKGGGREETATGEWCWGGNGTRANGERRRRASGNVCGAEGQDTLG
eukprot:6210836-Pleurochrysis_carterae.AAC.1